MSIQNDRFCSEANRLAEEILKLFSALDAMPKTGNLAGSQAAFPRILLLLGAAQTHSFRGATARVDLTRQARVGHEAPRFIVTAARLVRGADLIYGC